MGSFFTNDASDFSASPPNLQETALPRPKLSHKSSKRNLRSATRYSPKPSPRRSSDTLTRPFPKSQTSSFLSIGRRNRCPPQSSSHSVGGIAPRFEGNSPIRKGGSNTNKFGHSLTSALVATQDFDGAASDSVECAGPLKKSVSKSKNVFSKFTDVLIDHFGPKASRRRGKPEGNTRAQSAASDNSSRPIVHDLPPERLALPQLNLPSQLSSDTMLDSQREAENMKKEKVRSLMGTDDANLFVASKRLTVVDEAVDFQSGQPMDDPFSELSPSRRSSTGFEARLRSGQGSRDDTALMDPFQAERILETSLDAILTTPPVGCSTPRRQSRTFSRCESPTRKSHDRPGDTFDLTNLMPAKPLRRTKANPLREHPLKVKIVSKPGQNDSSGVEKNNSGSQNLVSSDSTRLSSFPPGSTIRRVPRSMGRLKDVPALPAATAEGARRQPLARKKHPSPSKGQLEMFGQYMEKNLALGVFQDSDELGMSFSSPQGNKATLSPRDTNRLIRSPAVSDLDIRKDCSGHSNRPGLSRSHSRIPQPVRQLSRSRTETAVARDFYPAEKGDSTVDELQWDLSAYKISHRCNHCGSVNEIV